MNKEFDNLDLDKKEDVIIKKEVVSEPLVEESKGPVSYEDIPQAPYRPTRTKRRDKRFYDEADSFYYENELGKDIYPKDLYAGFFRRMFSFIIDSIIGGAISSIIIDGLFSFTSLGVSNTVYTLAKTLIVLLYFTISTYLTKGQTLGKMMFGLKVVSLDGKDLSLGQVITREFFGRYIHTYGILFLLYILTAFTERKQNLSDLFADTSVLDLSKARAYEIGQLDREYSY